jgi:predicted nucleotidyltransferase
MAEPSEPFPPIVETLRKAAAALRDADVEFVLGGSLACWARGGPEVSNDLDLLVRPEDADAALEALAAGGMRPERPPEDWLYKAWDGEVLVDLIFRLVTGPVDDRLIQRAEHLKVASVSMRVVRLEDFLAARLLALDEHNLDLSPLVLIGRALREKVDWEEVRERVDDSAYASAYLHLLGRLGVLAPLEGGQSAHVTVRPAEGPPERATPAAAPAARGPAPRAP